MQAGLLNKKKIIVFIDSNLQDTIKLNYTFNLRIKSNLDDKKIQSHYNIEYIRINQVSAQDIISGYIFIFSKAQFFLSSARMLVSIIKRMGKAVLFDIDDYYLDVPDYSFSSHLNHGRRLVNFKKNLTSADAVIVSTEFLKKQLIEYNNNITVIENTIPVDNFKKPAVKDKSFNILVTSNDNLKLTNFRKDFIKCLSDLKKEYNSRIKLIFLGKFSNIEDLNNLSDVYRDRVPPEEYVNFLKKHNIHLGLVPLGGEEDKDTLLSHSCKSNIKFLEFASFGIAGIYSNVEPYKSIRNSREGIVVDNNYNDWYVAIMNLIEVPSKCKEIVEFSQKKVKDEFSKEVSRNKWFITLDQQGTMNNCDNIEPGKFLISGLLVLIKIRYYFSRVWLKILFVLMLIKKRKFKEILARSKQILSFKN